MEISNSFFFFKTPRKSKPRYAIFVTPGGRWFLIFTIFVVTVTMTTDNNILYFLSSFLLASVFLSSLFSDLAFYKIKISRILGPAFAKETPEDIWEIKNPTPLPLLGLEVGEWQTSHCVIALKIPYLGPFKSLRLRPTEKLPQRGSHVWQSLYIATEAPFSFTKKFFFFNNSGERLIWPEKTFDRSLLREIESKKPERNSAQAKPSLDLADYDGVAQGDFTTDMRQVLVLKSNLDSGDIVKRNSTDANRLQIPPLCFDFSEKSSEKLIKLATFCLLDSRFSSRTRINFPAPQNSKSNSTQDTLNRLSLLPPEGPL